MKNIVESVESAAENVHILNNLVESGMNTRRLIFLNCVFPDGGDIDGRGWKGKPGSFRDYRFLR